MKFQFKNICYLLCLFAIPTLYGCGGCNDEPPRARIINNGTVEVSAQIKTSNGNTENLNNIQPGTASEMKSYAPGEITFTITPKNSTELVEMVNVSNCMDYEIILNQENQIIITPTERE